MKNTLPSPANNFTPINNRPRPKQATHKPKLQPRPISSDANPYAQKDPRSRAGEDSPGALAFSASHPDPENGVASHGIPPNGDSEIKINAPYIKRLQVLYRCSTFSDLQRLVGNNEIQSLGSLLISGSETKAQKNIRDYLASNKPILREVPKDERTKLPPLICGKHSKKDYLERFGVNNIASFIRLFPELSHKDSAGMKRFFAGKSLASFVKTFETLMAEYEGPLYELNPEHPDYVGSQAVVSQVQSDMVIATAEQYPPSNPPVTTYQVAPVTAYPTEGERLSINSRTESVPSPHSNKRPRLELADLLEKPPITAFQVAPVTAYPTEGERLSINSYSRTESDPNSNSNKRSRHTLVDMLDPPVAAFQCASHGVLPQEGASFN